MSPSLNELVKAKAEKGGRFDDAEDMMFQRLTLNKSAGLQAGTKVEIVGVDMTTNSHTVQLPTGVTITFSNDEDVYERA